MGCGQEEGFIKNVLEEEALIENVISDILERLVIFFNKNYLLFFIVYLDNYINIEKSIETKLISKN